MAAFPEINREDPEQMTMRPWKLGFVAVTASMLCVCATPAMAQTLYGITIDNRLITINTVTGSGTLISVGSGAPKGLAFLGPKLYTFEGVDGTPPHRVWELNPANGTTIAIIDIGVTVLGEGAFRFRNDGIGFISGGAGGAGGPGQLWRFDISVPNSTPITAAGGLNPHIDGLAFDPSGILYGLDEAAKALYTINQATGATTLVGNTGIPGDNFLSDIAFDSTGKLFAAVCETGPAPPFTTGPSTFYQISPATGAATLIGPIGVNGLCGIAFQPLPTPPGVTVTPTSVNVGEGGPSANYSVVLNSLPTANVTISRTPGIQVTVAPPGLLTFTPANWNVPQTVTVNAVDDIVVEGLHMGTIIHTATSTDLAYNGIAISSVTANITDNDVTPLQPPPNSGGGEGSHAGAFGSGGGEGTFGFGRGLARNVTPILHGPTSDVTAAAGFRVTNVSYRQLTPTNPGTDSGFGPVGWTLLTGLAMAIMSVVAVKYRSI